MTSRSRSSTAGTSPGPGEPAVALSSQAEPSELPPSKTRLRLIAAVVVLWGIVVAVMWLTTANPVALSVPQIERADVIVTGRRPDPKSQQLHVLQIWRGDLPLGNHAVLNLGRLKAADMPPGMDFFVPLSHARSGLVVTKLPLQDPEKPPLVYPVTPATTRELQEMLARPVAAPAPH